MPNALDFSGQAEAVKPAASALDFSAYAAPATVDPRAVAAFRAQHASDVPLPPSLDTSVGSGGAPSLFQRVANVSAGAGDALTAALARTPQSLNLASAGLNTLLGLNRNADADFARAQALQSEIDSYQRSAQTASPNGAVAGNVLGIVPKLVAPQVLAVDALSHGSELGMHAVDAGVSVPRAEALMLEGNTAGLAQNFVPGNVPGNLLTRALSGAAINAGMQTAEQGVEHATAPTVVGAPTAKDAATAAGIGAILAAALGHGAAPAAVAEHLVADPPPQGLPRGADYSAKAEPVRPAPVDLGGNVNVTGQGEAYTPQQGASAFGDALAAARARAAAPALGEPVVAVDAAGRAATTADQHAALQPAPPVVPDPLGLTDRQRALIAADPRTAREGAPIGPKALPPPVVTVDSTGQAQTTSQFQQAIQRAQQAATERQALGITPDIERTQGTRWAQQDQAARELADRQQQLRTLDEQIAAQEQANQPARGRNAKPDETVDDALTFLAKSGGLDRRTFIKEGIDPAVARAPENRTRGGASRPLFRAQGAGGMSLDQVAETLWQHGYLPSADNNAALDLILAGVNHDTPTYSIHRQDQGDLLALKQAKQDAENAPPPDYADVPFSRKSNVGTVDHPLPKDQMESAPSGAWVRGPTVPGVPSPDLFQIRDVPLDQLHLPELDSAGALTPEKRKYAEDYAARLQRGEQPPNARGYELPNGQIKVVDGHRRAMAARAAGLSTLRVAVSPIRQPAAFSFAGERALTADRGALAQAQHMEAMGRDSVPDRYGNQPGGEADTHIATGWSRGKDGKWRFEIDDSAATVDPSVIDSRVHTEAMTAASERALAARAAGDSAGNERAMAESRDAAARMAKADGATVGDVLDHPALFAAYPELAKVAIKVSSRGTNWGAYNASTNTITMRPPSDYPERGDRSMKSVLLHEIQHAIQDHEGFARGGNSREFMEPRLQQRDVLNGRIDAINRLLSKASREGDRAKYEALLGERSKVVKQLQESGLSDAVQIHDAAHRDYRALAGEVEARNTQRRMNLPAAERRQLPPSETEDVPRSQQIVRFNNPTTAERSGPDAQDARAITTYSARLSEYVGKAVRFSPASHVPEPAARALAAFDDAFGGRTLVVHNDTPDALDLNGVTLRDGVRLVNEDATSPLLTVAAHEMVHQLRKDAPELYAELEAEVRRQGRLDAYGAELNARARASGENRDVDPRVVAEELTADATGDALSDPDFIERLAQQNPGLFRRLAQRLMDFFASVSQKLRGLGSSQYLRDVEAFRTKLADVLERYAERQQAGRGAREGGEMALSRKTAATDQTQTPEFRRWFGDSKVVDAEGKPLVVYHGTGNLAEMDSFKPEYTGQGNDQIGSGFYFTTDPSEASSYAHAVTGNAGPGARKLGGDETPGVASVYLSIKNPIRVDGPNLRESGVHLSAKQVEAIIKRAPNIMDGEDSPLGNWHDIWGSGGVKPWMISDVAKHYAGENLLSLEGDFFRDDATAFRHALADVTGHDGVMHDFGNGKQHWVAWFPEQIKSAIGNRGTFDPEEPSILFSRKPVDDSEYLKDMPSRRPGESQEAYLRRITRKNAAEIKAATALVKQQRQLGRYALRGMMATLARQSAIADAALAQARRTFDKTPQVINFASVHQWETGQPITDPDFRDFVQTMQAGFDQRIAKIHQLAPGALQSLIENYMPHLYEDSGKALKWYQNALGKRPLQGDRSFLKQREWPTMKDAMASGLKPISPNPVDWVLMKYHQMDKFIGLLTLKEDFARRGWLMKIDAGQRVPEGFARVDDPAFQIAGGLQGSYVVPEMIAKDINNYLAPGLSRYGAWRSIRAVQNAMVSWNLGWSAFHAGFTSIDNAVTHGAVGLQRLLDGDLKGGLVALVKAVPTMLTSPFEGGKLNRQWTGQAETDAHTDALLDLLEQGGARMKMGSSTAEYNNALPQVLRTIRQLQAPGAVQDRLEALTRRLRVEPGRAAMETGWGALKGAGKAISALGEVGSFLIHHVLVPNQKMAARVTLLKFELDHYAKALGKERGDYAGIISVMNPDVAKQLASDVVDKVDFRLGQMTYDNFFYPKIAREIAQLLVMAPGWQAGAFQTMTGGIKDVARLAKPERLVGPLDKAGTITDATRPRFTNNLANLIMLFLMVGGGNALYQWLVSGIEPDQAKDLVAPRTGRKNADDSDERIVLPSYMKDHYEFFHHPLSMASHKLHPAWRLMWELAHNEDYFGNMIRDPHHSLGQQAKELTGYLLKSMLPFTAANTAKLKENGASATDYAANFVGITPAPASLTRTPFQAFVAKGGARGWDGPARTPSQAAYSDKMRKAEAAMRTGQTPDLTGLTPKDVANLQRRVSTLKPEMQFDRLSLADKLDAYELATPAERRRYHLDEVLQRIDPRRSIAFLRLPADEQQALLDQLARIRSHSEAIGP